MKATVKKTVGAGLMSFGLVFGLSGLAGAQMGLIDTTGPDSTNVVKERTSSEVRVRNNNNLNVGNTNMQDSLSGDAKVRRNTTAGSARSGDASNANTLNVRAAVANSRLRAAAAAPFASGSDSATIKNTGPDSHNRVEIVKRSEVRVTNDNNVNVTNVNTHVATSGDASVVRNTTGGSATTGDASNTSSTSMTFEIKN